MSTIVTTQAELDAAIAADKRDVVIKSPPSSWLVVRDSAVGAYDSATVEAYGSATVAAHGSATVEAYGSATVRAYGSATVEAYDSATVQAYGSATVRAYGSATVRAYDSATVQAYDSATVQAYDSATVRAYDSATVEAGTLAVVRAYDSATVRAYDSATVQAYGSATVQAYDSATVEAGTLAVVRKMSTTAKVTGGIVIDHSTIDECDPATWAGIHLATVKRGRVALYKALGDDLTSGQRYGQIIQWATTGTVTCGDFEPTNECGHGLHLSPSIDAATQYRRDATRWLRCTVKIADIAPIPGDIPKCKAKAVTVVCEVDRHGNPIDGRP